MDHLTSDTATASDIIENGEWTPSLRCAIVIHYKSIYSMGGWTHETTASEEGLCLSLSLLVTHSRVAGGIKVKEAWQKRLKSDYIQKGCHLQQIYKPG